jgi:hypothetical protein
MGSAPRARQGEAPAKRRRRPERYPRSSALSHILNLRGRSCACADPLFERPLRAGDPPPLGSPWHFGAPVKQLAGGMRPFRI